MSIENSKNCNLIDWNFYFYIDETSPSNLRWKIKTSTVKSGDIAGSKHSNGGWCVKVKQKKWFVHRIIYYMYFGEIKEGNVIDHINGNPFDNLINNLRSITATENSRNSKKRKHNTSGVTGVNFFVNKKTKETYVKSFWYEISGKTNNKLFSVKKYGLLEAFNFACNFRKNMMKKLNEQGANYSKRHLSH